MRHKAILLLGLILTAFSQTSCVLHNTGATEVGVRTIKFSLFNKSGVENKIYAPGSSYFFLSILNDWHTFDTKIQNMEMTYSENIGDVRGQDDIKFKTIDGNDISLDLIVSYRVNPKMAPHILEYVAKDDAQLRFKIVRTLARSIPRDIFGELETEYFYKAEKRAEKSEKAKEALNSILNPMGVVVERVLTKDYRFNSSYQKAIEDKKIADQKTEQFKSANKAKEEEYKRKLEEAKGEVNIIVAKADGNFEKYKIKADAYFIQQKRIAQAIRAEAIAEAKGIQAMNAALAEKGGAVMVKLKIAEALKGKKIFLLPSGSQNGLNLQTMDLNKFLEPKGTQTIQNTKSIPSK